MRAWLRPSPGARCSVVSVPQAPAHLSMCPPSLLGERGLCARKGWTLTTETLPFALALASPKRTASISSFLRGQAWVHREKFGLGCGQKTFPIAVSS